MEYELQCKNCKKELKLNDLECHIDKNDLILISIDCEDCEINYFLTVSFKNFHRITFKQLARTKP